MCDREEASTSASSSSTAANVSQQQQEEQPEGNTKEVGTGAVRPPVKKTKGVDLCVPDHYTYCAIYNDHVFQSQLHALHAQDFLRHKYHNNANAGYLASCGRLVMPYTERKILRGDPGEKEFDLFIVNKAHNGEQSWHVYFESAQEHARFINSLDRRYRAKFPPPVAPPVTGIRLHQYIPGYGWKFSKEVQVNTAMFKLVGHEKDLELVLDELAAFQRNQKRYAMLGEVHSTNMVFVGPPGTGKTSMVRLIAKMAKPQSLPVYMVDSSILAGSYSASLVHSILNPPGSDGLVRLVVLEDFDRFLQSSHFSRDKMDALLNALDGIEDQGNGYVFRIFTANNMNVIRANEALMSRITSMVEFDYPSRQDLMEKFSNLIKGHADIFNPDHILESANLGLFFDTLQEIQGITYRVFTRFVLRGIASWIGKNFFLDSRASSASSSSSAPSSSVSSTAPTLLATAGGTSGDLQSISPLEGRNTREDADNVLIHLTRCIADVRRLVNADQVVLKNEKEGRTGVKA
jgi:hypothetical protein